MSGALLVSSAILYLIGVAAVLMIWSEADVLRLPRIPLRWHTAPLALLWLPIAIAAGAALVIDLALARWRRCDGTVVYTWSPRVGHGLERIRLRCPRCHRHHPEA